MRIRHRILSAFVLLALCLTGASCSENEWTHLYANTTWAGEYPLVTFNETTGEYEDRAALLLLRFNADGQTCTLMHGIAGMSGMFDMSVIKELSVRWNSHQSFALCQSVDYYPVYYSGTIDGGTMELMAFNCDSEATRYTLEMVNFAE